MTVRAAWIAALSAAGLTGAASGQAYPPPAELAPAFSRKGPGFESRWDFAGVPAPFADPTLGDGLSGAAGYVFKFAGSADLSFIGAAGAISNFASGGAGIAGSLNFGRGSRQLNFSIGVTRLNVGLYGASYDFYGVGFDAAEDDVFVDVTQDFAGGQVEVYQRVAGPLSLGLRARYLDASTALDEASFRAAFPTLEPDDFRQDNRSLALIARYNSRNNLFDSDRGAHASLEYAFSSSDFGDVFDADLGYRKLNAALTLYRGAGARRVWVYRAKICTVDGLAPFFDLCIFGVDNDLRGYGPGQFRDRALAAGQVEYRYDFNARWTAVGFAGVGAVADGLAEIRGDELLPSVGAGVLFEIFPRYGVKVGVDYAVGRDSDAVYLRFGHAF